MEWSIRTYACRYQEMEKDHIHNNGDSGKCNIWRTAQLFPIDKPLSGYCGNAIGSAVESDVIPHCDVHVMCHLSQHRFGWNQSNTSVMTSRNKDAFAVLAFCAGNPVATVGFALQRASKAKLWLSFLQGIEQTAEVTVIWHAVTLLWCHSNVV